MKKLVLFIGLFSFVMFGALSIQSIFASTNHIEFVKFDKDPKKDKKNKDAAPAAAPETVTAPATSTTPATAPAQETKEVKATTAKTGCCAQPMPGCCSKDKKDDCPKKTDCPTGTPDKK